MLDDAAEHFEDRIEFFDDVLGAVLLNQLERDCIDAPEFQRLFRIQQLGCVDLLYPSANHTRGIHSIGACARSKHLVDRLNDNTPRIARVRERSAKPAATLPKISAAERCLISLAGLLHDLPHGPLSHDIEKKTHRYHGGNIKVRSYYGPYDKHDDFERNPALFIMLFDVRRSILARVLRHHSPHFWNLLGQDSSAPSSDHLKRFVAAVDAAGWTAVSDQVLPALLFHLLVFEDLHTAVHQASIAVATEFDGDTIAWGLGPSSEHHRALHEAWYQPYRHDIVGNTLSADLLDYLARDAQRLGMKNMLDNKLLAYYVLVEVPTVERRSDAVQFESIARCAIDLNDYKRGVIRSERINDVFRMLDFRHEIHEKAVYHRVVQSAISMTARAVSLAGDAKPKAAELYGIGEPLHALWGDEHLLRMLATSPAHAPGERRHHALAQKLIERRVYRPLMIVPGDQATELLGGGIPARSVTEDQNEETLRLLGAILDSTYFAPLFCLVCWSVERLLDHSFESVATMDDFINGEVASGARLKWAKQLMPRRVVLWATPYKQLYKDPGIVVRAGERVGRIDELASSDRGSGAQALPSSLLARLKAGLRDSASRYASMWRVYVFMSDGLFYAGGLARLIPDHDCRKGRAGHKRHLEEAQDCIIRAVQTAWEWWHKRGAPADSDLNQPISDDLLVELLRVYTGNRYRYESLYASGREAVSAVDIEQYLHLESDEHCRDVRYKFDRPADLDKCINDSGIDAENAAALRGVFSLAAVDLAEISHEEVADIVAHLAKTATTLEAANVEIAARVGATLDPKKLRRAWLESEINSTTNFPSSQNATRDASATVPPTSRREESQGSRARDRREGKTSAQKFRLIDSADPPVEGGQ